MSKQVIVIIGTGGMGMAIARRIGTGRKLVLADYDGNKLSLIVNELTDAGYDVTTQHIDVVSLESVQDLAKAAVSLGEILAVINTAGISSTMNNSKRIFEVNLIGNANVIEVFENYVVPGSVGIIIASMAGHFYTDDGSGLVQRIKAASRAEMVALVDALPVQEPAQAYVLSKHGNHLQVQSAALSWGKKGARILSVSPGIIATPQSKSEMQIHASMRNMIENGPAKRLGTPEDIAALVDFLHSSSASFMTGADVLVDGGQVAFMRSIRGNKTNQ